MLIVNVSEPPGVKFKHPVDGCRDEILESRKSLIAPAPLARKLPMRFDRLEPGRFLAHRQDELAIGIEPRKLLIKWHDRRIDNALVSFEEWQPEIPASKLAVC